MDTPYLLLAEDDPDDREILRDALGQQRPGLGILCVDDGQRLIEYLDNCPSTQFPSIILLDYCLPLMSADQILDALSRKPRYRSIPKLVWSTSDKSEYARRCIERGALSYLPKPAAEPELALLISGITRVLDLYGSTSASA
ncbi:MAG: response regulator [Bacteroidota bacterium]|nr:response regulator [Bacteroidota bacterium]MDP4216847.1 response regulator [Bacteroidota bacterium]MDP4244832.1 response regulator [Bacteroidota bacterium]MDP4255065.1 response regulator [Bacteroidota bacterium]MDP4260523.1 response regulator [Bacteroidota bacterium]